MYEKLTEPMRRVLDASQRIARDYEQDYVGTEHMLLAIIQEDAGGGAALLKARGITLGRAKAAVDKLIKKSLEDTWVFGRLPGTPHFRNVMAGAIEEARRVNCKEVRAEHLLAALAAEEGSVAYAALEALGVTLEMIREEIAKPSAGR